MELDVARGVHHDRRADISKRLGLCFGLGLRSRDPHERFYRVVFLSRRSLLKIVVGLIWQWILYAGMQNGEHIGLLNYWLAKTGFPQLVHNWLSDRRPRCRASRSCTAGRLWLGFIMLLAGLQTIDRQLYEAARVDGANSWNTFRHVTIPMMLPVIVVVMILTILGSMQVFVLILSMVGQGLVYHTEVPVTRILSSMTGTNRFGYACAQGVTFGVVLVMVSIALKQISTRMKQE